MPWNIPILLTWMRVLLIPVFTLLFYLPKGWLDPQTVNWTAVFIFAAAAVTDWFDGFLARRWKQTSDFGAFLDPVADKLMVAVAQIGKLKTTAQMAAIMLLLAGMNDYHGLNFIFIGNILMTLAAVLTIWSMFYYLKMAWREFK